MNHSLFISDLHLCESRPEIVDAFIAFLSDAASKADALYILGDLFEYWAGDDAIKAGIHKQSIAGLKQLAQQGVSVYFIHGNRDFLIGSTFAEETQVQLLDDPELVELYGQSILLGHGDALCTDDIAYQQFKREVRSEAWQQQFLSQPLDDRIAYIEATRIRSEQQKSAKSMQIMDVNVDAVEALFAEYDYPPILIHGHTHRPMRHQYDFNGNHCERWVLGDWYEQGSYLRLDATGLHSHSL